MTRLNEIKARCEAATPGHWSWEQEGGDTVLETNAIGAYFGKIHSLAVLGADGTEGDAAFIAHAREDIPYLLSEVDRLQAGQKMMESDQASAEMNLERLTAERDAALRNICEICQTAYDTTPDCKRCLYIKKGGPADDDAR